MILSKKVILAVSKYQYQEQGRNSECCCWLWIPRAGGGDLLQRFVCWKVKKVLPEWGTALSQMSSFSFSIRTIRHCLITFFLSAALPEARLSQRSSPAVASRSRRPPIGCGNFSIGLISVQLSVSLQLSIKATGAYKHISEILYFQLYCSVIWFFSVARLQGSRQLQLALLFLAYLLCVFLAQFLVLLTILCVIHFTDTVLGNVGRKRLLSGDLQSNVGRKFIFKPKWQVWTQYTVLMHIQQRAYH